MWSEMRESRYEENWEARFKGLETKGERRLGKSLRQTVEMGQATGYREDMGMSLAEPAISVGVESVESPLLARKDL